MSSGLTETDFGEYMISGADSAGMKWVRTILLFLSRYKIYEHLQYLCLVHQDSVKLELEKWSINFFFLSLYWAVSELRCIQTDYCCSANLYRKYVNAMIIPFAKMFYTDLLQLDWYSKHALLLLTVEPDQKAMENNRVYGWSLWGEADLIWVCPKTWWL